MCLFLAMYSSPLLILGPTTWTTDRDSISASRPFLTIITTSSMETPTSIFATVYPQWRLGVALRYSLAHGPKRLTAVGASIRFSLCSREFLRLYGGPAPALRAIQVHRVPGCGNRKSRPNGQLGPNFQSRRLQDIYAGRNQSTGHGKLLVRSQFIPERFLHHCDGELSDGFYGTYRRNSLHGPGERISTWPGEVDQSRRRRAKLLFARRGIEYLQSRRIPAPCRYNRFCLERSARSGHLRSQNPAARIELTF